MYIVVLQLYQLAIIFSNIPSVNHIMNSDFCLNTNLVSLFAPLICALYLDNIVHPDFNTYFDTPLDNG